ncbi:MAG: phosphopentomutase [Ignavibacteriales bacterium]|nr:phosphopentomutase [Ignavibacteriales bacterium]
MFIVLDGVGIGELPDAPNYNDQGSNTIVNTAAKTGGLKLPNMQALGLGNISSITGVAPVSAPTAAFGKMSEVSKGKDSTSGHWELTGIISPIDFDYFPHGFPPEMMENFMRVTGCKGFLGNKAASGTEIIKELGEEHIRTGFPIVYTSADSVFQIAAHEAHFGLERLYEICDLTRHIVLKDNFVGRVIARPFVGESSDTFKRTTNRRDYSLDPPADTVLNHLQKGGVKTIAIGKIGDLFNEKGLDVVIHTKSNNEGCEQTLKNMQGNQNSFIMTNLVDFDVYFGHRLDPQGFKNALEDFDKFLPKILEAMDETDVLLITADHGNDPTVTSTDHTREYVPVLLTGKGVSPVNLGTRKTFADAGKTVLEWFGLSAQISGESFFRWNS